MTDYAAVWLEEQNAEMLSRVRYGLDLAHTIRVALQPGDATRYEFQFTPIRFTERYEFSNDGRNPKFQSHAFSEVLIASILNEGFAREDAAVHRKCDASFLETLGERMGIRNPCTTQALIETIKAVWL